MPRFHLVSILASGAGGGGDVRAASAEEVPRRIRPRRLSRRRRVADAAGRYLGARIFTNDEWGDYLIYSLYPRHLVFVDGRSDFYGDDFEEKYIDVLNVKYGWEQTLSRFGMDTILLPPERSADRRAEGIEQVARGLRRRRRADLPGRDTAAGPNQVSVAAAMQRRSRP